MEAVINAIVAGLVTMALNAIALALYSQRLKDRDDAIRLMNERLRSSENEIKEISQNRLEKIEQGITHAAAKRKEIYETLENNMVNRAWCKAHRDMTDSNNLKIENQMSRLTAQIGENNAQTARIAAVVELIANQLCLSLGKPTPQTGAPK